MMKIKKALMMLALVAVIVSPKLVDAQLNLSDKTYGIGTTNPGVGGNQAKFAEVIGRVITFLLGFVGALSVLVIIIGGIFYIISGGDQGKAETAKGYILYAVVGLVVALLGWVIVNTVIEGLAK